VSSWAWVAWFVWVPWVSVNCDILILVLILICIYNM
jgi:hypothetical protein